MQSRLRKAYVMRHRAGLDIALLTPLAVDNMLQRSSMEGSPLQVSLRTVGNLSNTIVVIL